ncbi:MAG: hypothetical protein R3B48_24275 [Kofleriaceae bacterium]
MDDAVDERGRAHGVGEDGRPFAEGQERDLTAFFGEHRPATSMVEVKALIDPAMLIEIEADVVE